MNEAFWQARTNMIVREERNMKLLVGAALGDEWALRRHVVRGVDLQIMHLFAIFQMGIR